MAVNQLREFKEVIKIFELVFEMKNFHLPGDDHLQGLLNNDSFYVIAAVSQHEVIGALTAHRLEQYYSSKPLFYIYDLAIHTNYQRRGVGKRLIEEINNIGSQEGAEEVFVQANQADVDALKFYDSTNGIPEIVVHFSYLLNQRSN